MNECISIWEKKNWISFLLAETGNRIYHCLWESYSKEILNKAFSCSFDQRTFFARGLFLRKTLCSHRCRECCSVTTPPRNNDIKHLPEKDSNVILYYSGRDYSSNYELQQRVCRTQDLEWAQRLGSRHQLATYRLCELGQATQASRPISSSANENNPSPGTVSRIKWDTASQALWTVSSVQYKIKTSLLLFIL